VKEQWAASLEFHRWAVAATLDGAPHDPTQDPLTFALSTATDADPVAPTDGFVNGQWETEAPSVYVACLLCGPGGAVAPTPGTYYVWMKVTDSPESPLRLVDTLKVR